MARQRRYKSVPVSGSDTDAHYFRIVEDYIHFNPARAGLAGGSAGKLVGYRWSSLPSYAAGKGPPWLEMERALNSLELAQDGRGRRAYVAWLEARATNDGGNIDEVAQDSLRRGWYPGEETFRDRLLALVQEYGPKLGLPVGAAELVGLRKGDERKAMMAALTRWRTAARTEWIATRLRIGHPGSVSRQMGIVRRNRQLQRQLDELEKM